MNLDDLRPKLLNPAKGPVDVEFEFILLKLLELIEEIAASASPPNDLQRRFCQQLRISMMIFVYKIATFYGRRYRGGTGGSILTALAEEGIRLIATSPNPDQEVLRSVRSHTKEIADVDLALPNDSAERPVALAAATQD